MILLTSPSKYDSPGKCGKHNLFACNCNSHNQNSQFRKYEKNLSSTSVDNERP